MSLVDLDGGERLSVLAEEVASISNDCLLWIYEST
jgi:hypothetical protein